RRPRSGGVPLQRTRLWTGAGRRGVLAHAGRADGVGRGAAHPAGCLPGAHVSARDGSQADASAHPRRPIARILTVWLSSTATLVLLSALLSGIEVDSFGAALGAAALIGMLNALLWPLILRFALPLTVLTLGLGAVILN